MLLLGMSLGIQMKRLYLKFEREDDLALYARLEADAIKQRYDVQTYILLVLLQAYPAPSVGTGQGSYLDAPQ